MTIDHFLAALTTAIPTIGAALLALWRIYVKQKADFAQAETDAADRKQCSHADHAAQDAKLDALQTSVDSLVNGLAAAQQEAAQLRAALAVAGKKAARLEKERDQARAEAAALRSV